MTDHPQKLAYSIKEFSALAGVGRTYLYDEVGAGRLIITKAGRRSIILHNDAMAWFALLPKLPPASAASWEDRS